MHICKKSSTFVADFEKRLFMKQTGIIPAIIAGMLLCGCTALEKKQQEGAAVEVNGHYLYRSTLDSLTLGLSSEDSLRVAQQFISQWAKDILMEEEAFRHPSSAVKKRLEDMVTDYRRTLYVQSYEEWLVERRMPKTVLDSTVQQVYEQMPERFQLSESIVRGLLVVVPVDAPNVARLKKWLSEVNKGDGLNGGALDNIEKYVYQNASGYELFADKWLTTTELMTHMPMERLELENALKTKNQIEVTDSLKTYLLQVTDKYLRGAAMPMEYARPEIEKMVLSSRQAEFLNKERERLYNEAVQEKKVNFF